MLRFNKERLSVPFKNGHTGSNRNDYVALTRHDFFSINRIPDKPLALTGHSVRE